MDMELDHTNVFINQLTMNIDIRADIVQPGFPPFNYSHLNLHYRFMYPMPVVFMTSGIYRGRRSNF